MLHRLKPLIVELKPSTIHRGGVGVFTLLRIAKGQKVGEGVYEQAYNNLVPWEAIDHLDHSTRNRIMNLSIGTPEGFIPPPNSDFNNLPFVFYFNHSCEGNFGFNLQGDFVALRDIEIGEELSSDYGLAESNPNFSMKCTCGTRSCRLTITGNDWKNQAFRTANIDHMLPRLR
jgi:hypothetical protein